MDRSEVGGGDARSDVVPEQTLVGEVVLLESGAAERDSDRACIFEVVVLRGAALTVAKQDRRSHATVINLLPPLDVKPDHGDVARRAGVRRNRITKRLEYFDGRIRTVGISGLQDYRSCTGELIGRERLH